MFNVNMGIPRIPPPICAKCNKKVDSVEVKQDNITSNIIYTAKCHGEEDTAYLTPENLLTGGSITVNEAFNTDTETTSGANET